MHEFSRFPQITSKQKLYLQNFNFFHHITIRTVGKNGNDFKSYIQDIDFRWRDFSHFDRIFVYNLQPREKSREFLKKKKKQGILKLI